MIGVILIVGFIKKVEINVSIVGFRNVLLWGCFITVSEYLVLCILFFLLWLLD